HREEADLPLDHHQDESGQDHQGCYYLNAKAGIGLTSPEMKAALMGLLGMLQGGEVELLDEARVMFLDYLEKQIGPIRVLRYVSRDIRIHGPAVVPELTATAIGDVLFGSRPVDLCFPIFPVFLVHRLPCQVC